MTNQRRKSPLKPGPIPLRDSVCKALLALRGGDDKETCLEISLIEEVERALRCELPYEILACFANGDDTLPEWEFTIGAVADHTARARDLGCTPELIAIGQSPNDDILFCVERRGDRERAVGIVQFEAEFNGDNHRRDLGDWLAERAGLTLCPKNPVTPVQLQLWPEMEVEHVQRVWCLVGLKGLTHEEKR